jgi:membrane protease YdiL (CAAX protease family)
LFPAGLDLALGGDLPPQPRGVPTLQAVLAAGAWIALFGGGEEEVGWRGFALPRLQRRSSPLIASLILSPFWSLWHMPLYFNEKYTEASNLGPAAMAGILTRFIWGIPVTILFTWLYNRSRGSLAIMILLHVIFNVTITFVGLSGRAGVLMFSCTSWIMALAFVLLGRMWRKLPAGELTGPSSIPGQLGKQKSLAPQANPQ